MLVGNRVSDAWYFFFRQLFGSLPPSGSGFVIDGSNTTYGQMTLFQGADSAKPAAQTGYIYFAIDTRKIYVVQAGNWVDQTEAFIGDVTKPLGSNVLTLATVNASTGTWGSSSVIPVFTVNSKGLVTAVHNEPIVSPVPAAAGLTTQVQYNNAGNLSASPNFTFDFTTNTLQVTNAVIPNTGTLTINSNSVDAFLYSDATRVVKSTASATDGQLLIGDTGSVPVAANLTPGFGIDVVNGAGSITIENTLPGPITFTFHYGDASPEFLMTVPAGKYVLEASVRMITAFNGTGGSVSVGNVANELLSSTAVSVYTDGAYTDLPDVVYLVDTDIYVFITPGTASQGMGLVEITLSN